MAEYSYLFPFTDSGSGPIRSMPILSQTLEIGIGFRVDTDFLNFGLVFNNTTKQKINVN